MLKFIDFNAYNLSFNDDIASINLYDCERDIKFFEIYEMIIREYGSLVKGKYLIFKAIDKSGETIWYGKFGTRY